MNDTRCVHLLSVDERDPLKCAVRIASCEVCTLTPEERRGKDPACLVCDVYMNCAESIPYDSKGCRELILGKAKVKDE